MLGHSYGNYFDPAKDCSHVVDNVPKAKSGVYWIQTANGPQKVSKIACDFFLLLLRAVINYIVVGPVVLNFFNLSKYV